MSRSKKQRGDTEPTGATSTTGLGLSRNRIILYAAVVVVAIIVALVAGTSKNGDEATTPKPIGFEKEGMLALLSAGDDTLAVLEIEFARTPHEQQVGLMFRDNLGPRQGMLFVYPYARYQVFWMKNETIPLDIIFVDKDKRVVNIHRYTVPDSEEKYASSKPAQIGLEVNAGLCDELGVDSTCSIDWTEF